MIDADFQRLKIITEGDLGREIDDDEERYLKGLFYFGKIVKLKAQLDSEPERIGPIAERALAEIEARRQARMGKMLAAIPDKPTSSRAGTRSLPPGIDKKESHHAQQLHKHEETIAQVVAEAREKGEIPIRRDVLKKIIGPHVSQNSGLSEWFTPPEYIEAARKVMVDVDVDPATTEAANKRIRAKTI